MARRPSTNLADVGACPPPSFWRFGAALGTGQLAAIGTGFAVRHFAKNLHPRNTAAITMITSLAAFWLGSGIMWVALSRKVPDTRMEADPQFRPPGRAQRPLKSETPATE